MRGSACHRWNTLCLLSALCMTIWGALGCGNTDETLGLTQSAFLIQYAELYCEGWESCGGEPDEEGNDGPICPLADSLVEEDVILWPHFSDRMFQIFNQIEVCFDPYRADACILGEWGCLEGELVAPPVCDAVFICHENSPAVDNQWSDDSGYSGEYAHDS